MEQVENKRGGRGVLQAAKSKIAPQILKPKSINVRKCVKSTVEMGASHAVYH